MHSTEVAQQFVLIFVDPWLLTGEKKILFTAIAGCATVVFGGGTLHCEAFFNSKSEYMSYEMMTSRTKFTC